MIKINEIQINELVIKLTNLIGVISDCVTNYYNSGKKSNISEVDDWNERLLRNLNNYKIELNNAVLEYHNGDSESLQGIASMVSSIERNMDNFSRDWMSVADKNKFEKALDAVSNIAYEISVLLYMP